MSQKIASPLDFTFPDIFVTNTEKTIIPVVVCTSQNFKNLKAKSDKTLLDAQKFSGASGQVIPIFSSQGTLKKIYVGASAPMGLYDMSHAADKAKSLSQDIDVCFELTNIDDDEIETACVAWGLACHAKDRYKSEKSKDKNPLLLLPKKADEARIKTLLQSICLVRDLINTPANDLGPQELGHAVLEVAKQHKAKVRVIDNQKTLEKNFPLVHTVGKASDRTPRLIDLTWGHANHPKLTLVGKGVIYDTGGLNLKPGGPMKNMKKDMGGAAHVLGLANLVMAMRLPVRLRVIIPAVENSVSGPAFRPGDILNSRKGVTVENTNTDAEGRLILADALCLATEEDTDLIIDCATLTGSARAAMGPDVPAFFSTDDQIAQDIKTTSFEGQDPLWPMPLIQHYNKFIESSIADIVNSVGVPGDLIFSALFLKTFLNDKEDGSTPNWVHIDMNAWNDRGVSGRPSGGADCGMRALFKYLEKRYTK